MVVVANVKHLANLLARHLVELPTKNVLAKKKINRKKLTLFNNLLTYIVGKFFSVCNFYIPSK